MHLSPSSQHDDRIGTPDIRIMIDDTPVSVAGQDRDACQQQGAPMSKIHRFSLIEYWLPRGDSETMRSG
jgi:hypothetical protein